jgi:hypothetical protein
MAKNGRQPTRLKQLKPDPKNVNLGTERGQQMLESSLRKYGAGRSILIDRNNVIIAGNKTASEAGQIGLDKIRVIETDGTELVAVKRTDLDLDRDKVARELAVADNRVAEVDLAWSPEAFQALDVDLSGMWTEQELAHLFGQDVGLPSEEQARQTLAEKFGVPPFSVLDARQGYWQDRKRAWLALGIKSEIGRGGVHEYSEAATISRQGGSIVGQVRRERVKPAIVNQAAMRRIQRRAAD